MRTFSYSCYQVASTLGLVTLSYVRQILGFMDLLYNRYYLICVIYVQC